MTGKYPLSRAKAHKVLLEFLAHPQVHLTYKPMPKHRGRVIWDTVLPPRDIWITVDANDNPLKHISTVIHELFHTVLYMAFFGWFTDDYEEVGILAYEQDMFSYVEKSPERLAKWTVLIAEKLKENEANGDPATG